MSTVIKRPWVGMIHTLSTKGQGRQRLEAVNKVEEIQLRDYDSKRTVRLRSDISHEACKALSGSLRNTRMCSPLDQMKCLA